MLYEVICVEKPTDKEKENGKVERIVGELQRVIAPNERVAAVPGCQNVKLDGVNTANLEVLVRPF